MMCEDKREIKYKIERLNRLDNDLTEGNTPTQ
jgi:hypothetical protein